MRLTDNLLPESQDDCGERDTTSSHPMSRESHQSSQSQSQYGGASFHRMASLNNQEHANTPSKKSIKQDIGDYYWANFESKWTLLDQKRLVSMDYLIHRSLEFHNNHHTFRASGNFDYSGEMGPPLMSDFALEVQLFPPGEKAAPPSQLIHFGEIDKGHLSRFPLPLPTSPSAAPSASSSKGEHIYWFNVKDIRALRPLALHLRMDTLVLSLFYDLRGRSTISALENGLFMSFCIVTLNGNDAELHKVYCYCTQSYMVTFERELISEPDDEDDPARLASTYRSPLSFDFYDETSPSPAASSVTKSVDKKRRVPTSESASHPPSAVSILSFLFSRMRTELFMQATRMGTMYMLYEIGMESLSHSDSMMEFVSRTIFYLKQQVHRKLTYTQKLHFHRKVHILLATLNLADGLVDEVYENLEKIFNKTSSQFSSLLQRYKFSHDHLAYISLLVDSYEFTSTCLERQIEDVNSLENVMGHLSAIRAEKVSTNLSLIATVFLPITFLASAFGMNFEKNGDYTMEILNSAQGPNIFYAMCVVVIILNLIAFLHSGLMTFRDTEAIIRPKTANFNDSHSTSKFMSCFSPGTSPQNSRDYSSSSSHSAIDNIYPHLGSSHSHHSLRNATDRNSIISSNSVGMAGDLERLDRGSLDDQSVVEEVRRQNMARIRRTYEANKTN